VVVGDVLEGVGYGLDEVGLVDGGHFRKGACLSRLSKMATFGTFLEDWLSRIY